MRSVQSSVVYVIGLISLDAIASEHVTSISRLTVSIELSPNASGESVAHIACRAKRDEI